VAAKWVLVKLIDLWGTFQGNLPRVNYNWSDEVGFGEVNWFVGNVSRKPPAGG